MIFVYKKETEKVCDSGQTWGTLDPAPSIDGSQFLSQQQKNPQHLHTPLTTMAFNNKNLSKRPSVQSAGPDLIPKRTPSVIRASSIARNKDRAMSVTAGDTPDLHKDQSPPDHLNQNHREAAVKLQRLR